MPDDVETLRPGGGEWGQPMLAQGELSIREGAGGRGMKNRGKGIRRSRYGNGGDGRGREERERTEAAGTHRGSGSSTRRARGAQTCGNEGER
jgi:hypothetical protein